MKTSRSVLALTLGAAVALPAPASAQDITIGVAGPMTGQYASFGAQLKNGAEAAVADINAAGGVLGKKLKLEVGDDACDPKQARAVADKFAGEKMPFVAGHYLLGVVDPGLGGLCRGRRPADHAGLDQPDVHRTQALEHVPRLRPRRPAGHRRRQLTSPRTSRARTSPSSHDKSTYGKGLADETKKALNKAGVQGEDVRGLHAGRQGLHRAGLQDEGNAASTSSMSAATTPRPA